MNELFRREFTAVDCTTILSDLSTLFSDIQILNVSMTAYDEAFLSAVHITITQVTLSRHLRNATQNAAALPTMGPTDAESILPVINILQPSIADLLAL